MPTLASFALRSASACCRDRSARSCFSAATCRSSSGPFFRRSGLSSFRCNDRGRPPRPLRTSAGVLGDKSAALAIVEGDTRIEDCADLSATCSVPSTVVKRGTMCFGRERLQEIG